MVSSILLLIFCALGPPPAQDRPPEELVRQLGSRVFAEREEAARALEALGRKALPTLAAASESEDAEVRARATVLLSTIQKRLLVEATTVRLEYSDRPVAEVAREIGGQAGFQVLLLPENQPMWQGRRISLVRAEPVPFWEALDALTELTQTQVQPAQPANLAAPGGLLPTLRLLPGAAPVYPTSDFGPFRCTLNSLHHHQDLTFQRSPVAISQPGQPAPPRVLNPQVNDQFYLALQIQAEPRLLINQSGPLRILEAIDDQGRSLAPSEANGGALRGNPYFGAGGPMSMIQFQATLLPPGDGKSRLRRFRGVVPLSVAALRPDPLTIPLADAAGKTFQSETTALTIDALKLADEDQTKSIDITLKSPGAAEGGDEDPFQVVGPRSMSALQVRFELINAQGLPVRFLIGRSQTIDGQTVQLSLTIPPISRGGTPVELRFRDIVATTTEVEFNFNDVPLP
jgi:hypothetical protein